MSGIERQQPGGDSLVPVRETAASVLPGLPRVAALDALLREVDGLRLTLETDLTLAAAAVESGAPDLAGELVDGDLEQLHAFETRALDHLGELAVADDPVVVPLAPRRRRVRLSVAPLAGAAAALVAVLGLLPAATSAEQPAPQTTAMSSWDHLTRLAGADASSGQLRTAALQWHAEVADLVERAATDPAAARQALVLLQAEQHVLAGEGDPAALGPVIAQSRALADRLRAALPAAASQPVRTLMSAVPRVPVPLVVLPTAAPRPKPSRTAAASPSPAPAKASPSASPVPTPAPSASTPAPTAQPTTAPSPTPRPDPLHLDGAKDGLSLS